MLLSLIEINSSSEIQEVVPDPSISMTESVENENSQSSEASTKKRKRTESDDEYVLSQASTISAEVNLDENDDVNDDVNDDEADDITVPNRDKIEKYRIYLVWCPSAMYCKIGQTALKEQELAQRYTTYLGEFYYNRSIHIMNNLITC